MSENVVSSPKQKVRATGLRRCLDERGIKYSFVARKVGIWPARMTGVLQGTRLLERDRAERMCELIGVPFFVAFDSLDESDTRS